MDEKERSTRSGRNNRKQQKTTIIIILAVVLLLIGGIAGSAIQSGRVKSMRNSLDQVSQELSKTQAMYETKIAALETEIAAKEAALQEAGAQVPDVEPDDDQSGDTDNTPDANGEQSSRGFGWFGRLVIALIVVIFIITALFLAINAFTKDKDDDDDDDDDEDDEYDDDDDDYEYEYDDEDDEE